MKNTIPEVDAYIDEAADFAQPILKKLRRLFHRACPEIQETIKWSSPFFEYKGIVGNTEMAVLRATSVEEMPADDVLVGYIAEAVKLNEEGVKVPRSKPSKINKELEITANFMAALGKSRDALATFEGFSHSNRKDYVEWVTEAKREATRGKRLATAVEWMAEGKPRNWKYMKDWR